MGSSEEISLPIPGAPVTVVVDDVRINAEVYVVEGRTLELAARTRALRPGYTDALLEFVGPTGPCRVRGNVTAPEDGRITFTCMAPPQLLLRSDRVRAAIGMVVDVELGGEFRVSTSRDLRGGGVLVAGPVDVQVGETVRFRLHLPEREAPIEGWAQVARTTENGDFALHFIGLSDEDRAAIMLEVLAAQRSQR